MRKKPGVKFGAMLIVWSMFFTVEWVSVVAVCVLLHEGAHMLVCRILNIPVLGVKSLPWGITASAPLMYEPFSQFLVSVSGPAFNFFLLFFYSVVRKIFGEQIARLFVLANFADGLLNLIPALPLDGGIILKAFLCAKFGFIRGFMYMIRITMGIGVVLMVFGIQMFLVTGYNISYFVAGVFIIYNLKHEKNLIMCMKKRILTGEIRSASARKYIRVPCDSNALCLIDVLSPTHTTVFRVMKNREEIGMVNQTKLVECILKNTMITVGECIEKN